VEIIYEAVERLLAGSKMQHIGELLVVSIAGLIVNLIGIMAFDHAHHGHGHHEHGNENMHGIFLHILADTLGSVAVVISTILVHLYGWSGFDPIASCIIAILIFASATPLVSSTANTLLLSLPGDVEYNLRDTLAGVSALKGVVGYAVPRFWLNDAGAASPCNHHHHGAPHGHSNSHDHSHHSHNHHYHDGQHHHHDGSSDNHDDHVHSHHHHDHSHKREEQGVLGVIHVIASRGADLDDVRQRTTDFFRQKNMNILIQVEREGDNRCWCGNGIRIP
jgi:solute carrier family 30 (zinc transporter), member 5/7